MSRHYLTFCDQNFIEFRLGLEEYFINQPGKTLWCNFYQVGIELDIRSTSTITTVGSKSVILNKNNDGMKQSYTVILAALNNRNIFPPMITFNEQPTRPITQSDKKSCEIWFSSSQLQHIITKKIICTGQIIYFLKI
ncbi:hypothetical protein ABPG74_015937 [Tetrahymena malaccensis]